MSVAADFHGTPTGYTMGCREACCRRAKKAWGADYARRVEESGPQLVDAEPTRRKIRALVAMGHSLRQQAEYLGVTRGAVRAVHRSAVIRRDTAERFDAMYREHEMDILVEDRDVKQTKTRARMAGWHPPLAWEDIDAGILAEVPREEPLPGRLDEGVVDHVLATHDFTVPMSAREKGEIVDRWVASGRSERSLCDLTGWRHGRYSRRKGKQP